jgi:GNAT superfamily N-acetyltransferase
MDAPPFERTRGDYLVSTDPNRLDFDAVHAYLTRSYWAAGIGRELVERAARASLCFGAYCHREQVGFARVVTDAATFAYLCDVYVVEEHRGRGVSELLMEAVMAHPSLQGLRRFMLVTKDAQGLYERYGFRPTANPDGCMEIARPGMYLPQRGND